MIEDVFLTDMPSICNFLKLKEQQCKLSGKNGYEKLTNLFKKANKRYLKGNTKDFISHLDMQRILQKNKKMFSPLIKAFEKV